MAPVRVKYIVSFSSQDDCHKASNLVASDGSKYWLSNKKSSNGIAEIVLQLEEPTKMSYLDIGTVWCATLELRVGRSDWHQTMEFKPLLPTVMLMSPLDCRLSRGAKTTQMFSLKDFSPEVSGEPWDRLHIICRQPYRKDVQFGISFIHIKNVAPSSLSGVQSDSSTSPCQTGKSALDASSIQKHFFGKAVKNGDCSPTDMLKYRLMKMAGSTENGCDQPQALSRTAQLVLKASENNGPYSPRHISSPLPKKGLFSEHLAKKNDVPINKEITAFLPTLNISAADIDNVTIADLRHKFERKKRRKLTKEEKLIFSEICQDFVCDLFDKKNLSSEMEKFGHILEAKTPKTFVAENKCDNPSSGLISPSSASKLKESHSKNKESLLMKTGKMIKDDSNILSASVDFNGSTVLDSPSSNVCLFKNDSRKKCLTPETLSKNKRVSQLSVAENNSKTSTCNLISEMRSPSAILNDNDISYEAVKKRRKWNPDKSEEQNLVCDNQDLLSVNAHSLQNNNTPLSRENQTISRQENDCDDKVTASSPDVVPGISYDREIQSNHEDSKHEALQSPGEKSVARDNVNKPYLKLKGQINQTETPAIPNPATVSSRKPAKLKKLNKASFDLFQEFSMEIMNEPEPITDVPGSKQCPDFSNSKQDLFQTGDTNNTNASPGSFSTKDIKTNASSTKSSPEKSTGQVNKTPKSAKGKIYRMYASRNKSNPGCHTEAKPDLSRPTSSSNNYRAQKHFSDKVGGEVAPVEETVIDFGNNCNEEKRRPLSRSIDVEKKKRGTYKQITDANASTLYDEMSSSKRKSKSDMNHTISFSSKRTNDGTNQTSRGRDLKQNEQASRRRSRSIPTPLPDTAFCDSCHGMYPTDTISTHRAFCLRPPSHALRQVTSVEPSWTNSSHEMFVDDSVDHAECPICLQRFPQDVLLVHASECGI